MAVVADSLTTKIKSFASDKYGRWVKVQFHAKKGTFVIYTVYRPNKSSLVNAGCDTVWMQQKRAFEHDEIEHDDPRSQLIVDLIKDITQTNGNKYEIIVLGNFNEDPRDLETNGIEKLMNECNLTNIFQYVSQELPSTRSNSRSIDHI